MDIRYSPAHVEPKDRFIRIIWHKHLTVVHLNLPLTRACPSNFIITNPFQIKSPTRGCPAGLNVTTTLARQPNPKPLILPSNVSLPTELYSLV